MPPMYHLWHQFNDIQGNGNICPRFIGFDYIFYKFINQTKNFIAFSKIINLLLNFFTEIFAYPVQLLMQNKIE